jgi:hypothetical protein
VDRRHFVEHSAFLTGGALISRLGDMPAVLGTPAAVAPVKPMIGIQAGAVSFVDEGTAPVLDNFEQLASINTIFLATFTYGRGIGGRQLRGSALPDHGRQEYDDNFHGGNFATPHPQYYRNTSIAPEKAPDHGSYDVIADVLPAAKKRHERHLLVRGRHWRERPRVRQGARSDAHRQGVDVCVLSQSKHATLLARHGGGLSSLIRHRRPHVGQRTPRPSR